MLTANTALQVRTNGTAFFGSHTYQLSYSILVEHLERVYFQNLLLQIDRQERSKSPVNWSRNTTCTRQSERNVPNAPNLKRWTMPPGT